MSSRDLTAGRAVCHALACAASIFVIAGNAVLADEAKSDKKPQALIRIAKETTYITEPLTDRGYVDYPGWLNRRMSEGVTPENNAAVLYWQAIGPNRYVSADYRKFVVDQLGVDVFAGDGPFLKSGDQFVEDRKVDDPDLTWSEFDRMLDSARKSPWRESDYPLVAEWIRVNARPLDAVVEGSRRTRFFNPLAKTIRLRIRDPFYQSMRQFGSLLCARVTLRLGKNEVHAAMQDALTLHRLAEHLSRGPGFVDWVNADVLESIALHCDRRIAFFPKAEADARDEFRRQLSQLKGFPPFADHINIGSRLIALEQIQLVARTIEEESRPERAAQLLLAAFATDSSDVKLLTSVLQAEPVDWNEALRSINERHASVLKAMRASDVRSRVDTIRDLVQELNELSDATDTGEATNFIDQMKKLTATARGHQLALLILGPYGRFFRASVVRDERVNVERLTTQLGIAIVAYRTRHGALPNSLDELVPSIIETIPQDPFSDRALVYRRRGNEFAVYSVGPDLKDDGGHGEVLNPGKRDIVFASDGWK